MWEDPPPNDWWSKWVLGTGIPVALVVVAIGCATSGYALLPGRRGRLELHDGDAAVFGLILFAAAAFLHVHFLWNNLDHLFAWVDLGKGIALIGMIASIGWLCVRVLV